MICLFLFLGIKNRLLAETSFTLLYEKRSVFDERNFVKMESADAFYVCPIE